MNVQPVSASALPPVTGRPDQPADPRVDERLTRREERIDTRQERRTKLNELNPSADKLRVDERLERREARINERQGDVAIDAEPDGDGSAKPPTDGSTLDVQA